MEKTPATNTGGAKWPVGFDVEHYVEQRLFLGRFRPDFLNFIVFTLISCHPLGFHFLRRDISKSGRGKTVLLQWYHF